MLGNLFPPRVYPASRVSSLPACFSMGKRDCSQGTQERIVTQNKLGFVKPPILCVWIIHPLRPPGYCYCLHSNHVPVVTTLMEGGADCNQGNKNKWTPVHVAVNKGHVDVVRALLAGRCDVNLQVWQSSEWG